MIIMSRAICSMHTSIKWGWVRHIVICIHPMGEASGFRDAIRQILLLGGLEDGVLWKYQSSKYPTLTFQQFCAIHPTCVNIQEVQMPRCRCDKVILVQIK